MLEKLYEKGYLDYKTMILDNYKSLNLEEREAFVMIKVLDQCQLKRNIKISEIVQATSFSKDDVQEILFKLSELGYYETYFELISGKGEEEFYNINPFFYKMTKIINEINIHENDSEIKQLIDLLETKLCRPLTALELETVSAWLRGEYSMNEITCVIKELVTGSHLTFRGIERQLLNRHRQTNKTNNSSELSKDAEDKLRQFGKLINERR